MADGAVVGIDLGTTMSVISYLDASHSAVTIPNREGDPLTPSAIYIDGDNVVVGKSAKDAAAHYPDKVATFIKRDIGQPAYGRTVDGRTFRPETLSAMILRKIKQDAERRIGPVSKAVITVPAFFDDVRRKATEDAGRIAGIEVLDIVNEPTAAAMAFSLEGACGAKGVRPELKIPGSNLTALVYDLGGGTFDVTVVRLARKRFDTLATDGEVQLGGKDWDDRIVDFIGKEFAARHGRNPALDANRREGISNLAETAKKLLSQLPSAPLEYFHEGHAVQLALHREHFEELTQDLIARTEIVTELVIKQAGVTWPDIDKVLLVGGSTRIPAVRCMLERVTGIVPDDSLDPDQVVSHGAAIFGAVLVAQSQTGDLELDDELQQELEDVVIQDVNAHSLGVQAVNRHKELVSAVLIPKNTQLPFASSKVFRLNRAGATNVVVKVLEGEAPQADGNIMIGECLVRDLPPGLPAKSPIQVRLGFETNGCVTVMALDMTGGRYVKTELRRQYGLTEDEVQREARFVQSLKIQ